MTSWWLSKKTRDMNAGEEVEKREPFRLKVGIANGAATVANSICSNEITHSKACIPL